ARSLPRSTCSTAFSRVSPGFSFSCAPTGPVAAAASTAVAAYTRAFFILSAHRLERRDQGRADRGNQAADQPDHHGEEDRSDEDAAGRLEADDDLRPGDHVHAAEGGEAHEQRAHDSDG